MKRLNKTILCILTIMLMVIPSACSEDSDVRSEYDIIGLWTDREGHYVDFQTPEAMYDYTRYEEDGYAFWMKTKPMYFYEPYHSLLCMTDVNGVMQVYKLISVTRNELTICWVATPDLSSGTGTHNYDFLKIFFDKTYIVKESNIRRYRKSTLESLAAEIGNEELVE